MAINPAFLISAAILQDYFVDNVTAAAMSGGVITLYEDNSRTTLKNWYYQSGTPNNYTWIPLPNPLTLSAVGTITDANGNDTIPFFYPYSEDDNLTPEFYYITVVDSNGQAQFTRQNFPYIGQGGGGSPIPTPVQIPTLENYIINNEFWRNIGTLNAGTLSNSFTLQYNLTGTYYYATVAPSQHDGFSMPDINYIKNVNGATETITFTPFGLGNTPLLGDITPEYYINHNCTVAQAGETLKCYQFPISFRIKTLESQQATITIQAQNVNPNANNIINISIYQFLGTGVTSPAPILEKTLVLNNNWQKLFVPFTFPSANLEVLGAGGDAALYLQIGMPLASTCNINFALPSLYLSNNVPTNYFQTYDQIDSIINTPRTGDVRPSFNTFWPYGWVIMNDGSIGNAASSATTRANIDCWPLFSTLYLNVSNTYAPVSGGRTSPGNTITAAYADWVANKSITLPSILGRALASAGAGSGLTSRALGQTVGEESHAQSIAEMPSHFHQYIEPATGGSGGSPTGAATTTLGNTTSTGGGTPFNVMQPTTFMNVFIKL